MKLKHNTLLSNFAFNFNRRHYNKHKFERFLHERRPSVATVYGPVSYPPAPVLGFKEVVTSAGMGARLVLSGNVRKADPDRIVLKRIILTGTPFKTHKSKAVVRQMFFNPEDIRWFKPLVGRCRSTPGIHS